MAYNSFKSDIKKGYRNEHLFQMELLLEKRGLTSVPKGQVVVLLEDRYAFKNKLPHFCTVEMGVRRGLFTYKQVVCVNKSEAVTQFNNRHTEKLGILNLTGTLNDAVQNLIKRGYKIFWVEADFMGSARLLGSTTGELMDIMAVQPNHAGLFVNANMKESLMGRHLEGDIVDNFRDSKTFRSARKPSSTKRGMWKEVKYFKQNAEHVTSVVPMQSALFVKSPNPNFSNAALKRKQNMEKLAVEVAERRKERERRKRKVGKKMPIQKTPGFLALTQNRQTRFMNRYNLMTSGQKAWAMREMKAA